MILDMRHVENNYLCYTYILIFTNAFHIISTTSGETQPVVDLLRYSKPKISSQNEALVISVQERLSAHAHASATVRSGQTQWRLMRIGIKT